MRANCVRAIEDLRLKAEIPTYFGFVMPRFEAQGMRPWVALALPALLLSLQHAAVPLLFDVRYMLWRGLMFLPFAFLVGIVVYWRPRVVTVPGSGPCVDGYVICDDVVGCGVLVAMSIMFSVLGSVVYARSSRERG